MSIEVDTSALLVYRAAWTKDTLRDRVTLEASMAKLHATEAAQRVIDATAQLFGGLGIYANNINTYAICVKSSSLMHYRDYHWRHYQLSEIQKLLYRHPGDGHKPIAENQQSVLFSLGKSSPDFTVIFISGNRIRTDQVA
jgi:hypothetical protein